MTQRELIDLAHSDDKTWHKEVVVAFLSNAKIWGKFFDESVPARFPPPPLPLVIACAHQFHSYSQNQPAVAQRAATTVAERSVTSCVGVCFPNRLPGQQSQHTQVWSRV